MLGKDQSTSTLIDSSAKLDGKFSSQADLVIKGKMSGMIETTKNIEIKESAKVKAGVKANNIIVAGKVDGNIEVEKKLDVTKTGSIKGDIKCKLLTIEPGAKIDGQCVMPEEVQSLKEKKFFGKKVESQAQEPVELHNPADKEPCLNSPLSNSGTDAETKTCSQCQGPMKYISEYQRWYCDQCTKYEKPESEENKEQDKVKEPEKKKEIKNESRNLKITKGVLVRKNKKKTSKKQRKTKETLPY